MIGWYGDVDMSEVRTHINMHHSVKKLDDWLHTQEFQRQVREFGYVDCRIYNIAFMRHLARLLSSCQPTVNMRGYVKGEKCALTLYVFFHPLSL